MNIAKLNPIGYEVQTDKGNKYKRSNIWKTAAIGQMALDMFALSCKGDWAFETPMFKASKKTVELFDKIFETKTPYSTRKSAIVAVWTLISALWIAAGILIDRINSENNRRKADGEKQINFLEQVQNNAVKIDNFVNNSSLL